MFGGQTWPPGAFHMPAHITSSAVQSSTSPSSKTQPLTLYPLHNTLRYTLCLTSCHRPLSQPLVFAVTFVDGLWISALTSSWVLHVHFAHDEWTDARFRQITVMPICQGNLVITQLCVWGLGDEWSEKQCYPLWSPIHFFLWLCTVIKVSTLALLPVCQGFHLD